MAVTTVMASLISTGYGGLSGHVDDASRLEPFPVRDLQSCGNRRPPIAYCLGLGTAYTWFINPTATLVYTFILAITPCKGWFWLFLDKCLVLETVLCARACTIIALDQIRLFYSQGIIDPQGWNTGQIISVSI